MGRFIVLDIVCYGNSLNYDQGVGNYQELKKITRWNGKQHTFVSRYALRYSILETAKKIGIWDVNRSEYLNKSKSKDSEEGKAVIQPDPEIIFKKGKIFNYPELDLFGFLITSTEPSIWREAPVKISHAVSLTPYEFDTHFSANIFLARELMKKTGEMDPDPFQIEEHQTYYIYNIVIDLDRVGFIEVISEENLCEYENSNWKKIYEKENTALYVNENKQENLPSNLLVYCEVIKIPCKISKKKKGKNKKEKSEEYIYHHLFYVNDVLNKEYPTDYVKLRILELLKIILNLKRNIKGRCEDLSPKILVLGLYKNKPYKTFKDKIVLSSKYEEEQKIERKIGKNNDVESETRKITLLKREEPSFILYVNENKPETLYTRDLEKVVDELLSKYLKEGIESTQQTNTQENAQEQKSSTDKEKLEKLKQDLETIFDIEDGGEMEKIYVFKSSDVLLDISNS